MCPVTYDPPEVIEAAKEAAVAHVTGVNIRSPEDGGDETITIYWEAHDGGGVADSGSHTIAASVWGEKRPSDPGTPPPPATYRDHIKALAYGQLIEDGIIPDGPIT